MDRDQLTAVLLFSYGGPGSLQDVRPYLRNIFSDPSILTLPRPLRPLQPLLAALMAATRAASSRRFYAAIGARSPLLEQTEGQAKALSEVLSDHGRFLVLPAMRYWQPRTDAAIRRALEAGAKRFVLLPLYPHFSRTTTGSSISDFRRAAHDALAHHLPAHVVLDYHDHPGFIATIMNTIAGEFEKMTDKDRRAASVLFSAHGLPQRIVEEGDPYQVQIEKTASLVVKGLGLEGRARVTYQSKVGPMRWLKPSTEEAIREFALRPEGPLLVYPIAFVSEHQETLYELDIKYGEIARSAGIDYRRLPTAGCRSEFIACLRDLTLAALDKGPPT